MQMKQDDNKLWTTLFAIKEFLMPPTRENAAKHIVHMTSQPFFISWETIWNDDC